ncbi:alpha/beta fold hydrolase [Microbulbifer hydrolyticus]|uniref:Alpha/beta fold hydrolase n=1 Tax=Microbulbifer hydrolyticus TaxID=48074 RepID=A0A6P1TDA3_9GAMM|nr:alpha/beta hydrolase [Microbulbifer hydrolyticus]MBB5209829.1 pimeloyl-ACP methyl ester carboxylesterase [Microbulbifer hydrolyticus]QHQ39626.1 alpha/beta fold hydrolase [Microbulbifer hydrolyticus]
MSHSSRDVFRDITLDIQGNTIAARQWGNPDGVPVLALHGWLDNCASFDAMAPFLAELNLVAVDLAGHGQSYHRHRDANYTIWTEIEDVLGIADALGWEAFSILAHSRGAVIATITAATFPERVQRLALIDGLVPPPATDAEAPDTLRRGIEQRARYRARESKVFSSLDVATTARKNGLFKLSDDAARRLVMRGVRRCEGGYTWSNDPQLLASSLAKLNEAQVEAFLGRVTMPIRLALGKDGIQGMIERIRPVAEQHPNIQLREFAGGHHLHMEDAAEAIACWFLPFLEDRD